MGNSCGRYLYELQEACDGKNGSEGLQWIDTGKKEQKNSSFLTNKKRFPIEKYVIGTEKKFVVTKLSQEF